jgi:proline dehydrogenase
MANEIRISEAIKSLNSSANFTVSANDVDRIWWNDDTTPIAKADILAKQVELQADYDAQDYARKRIEEYPTVHDLVVALYDTDDKAAIDAKRAEIKLKYPKPVA